MPLTSDNSGAKSGFATIASSRDCIAISYSPFPVSIKAPVSPTTRASMASVVRYSGEPRQTESGRQIDSDTGYEGEHRKGRGRSSDRDEEVDIQGRKIKAGTCAVDGIL